MGETPQGASPGNKSQPPTEGAAPQSKKSPKQKRAEAEAARKEWSQEEIDAALIANGGTPKGHEGPREPAEGKRGVGRPRVLGEQDWERAEALAAGGLTKVEIAESMGIGYSTLFDYEAQFPEFSEAIRRGRTNSVQTVISSLHRSANGFAVPEEKIIFDSQTGRVLREKTIKVYQPDVKAQHIILQHAETGSWKPKTEMDHHFPEPLILKDLSGKPLESLGAQAST